MDKTQETIRDNMKAMKKLYMLIWKVIDKRWTGQLHQLLHVATYYLNPAIKFFGTFKKDREVMHGLLNCVEVLVTDYRAQDVVHNELNLYDNCIGDMRISTTIRARKTMRPGKYI